MKARCWCWGVRVDSACQAILGVEGGRVDWIAVSRLKFVVAIAFCGGLDEGGPTLARIRCIQIRNKCRKYEHVRLPHHCN